MMNNIFFRILLAIYAFSLTLLSIGVMYVTILPYKLQVKVVEYITGSLIISPSGRLIILITAFIFFTMSMMFLLSGLKRDKNKKAISKNTNIGEIKISLNTIENIALAASRFINGVKDSKAYVFSGGDKVTITIKAIVIPDVNIPALSEDIQIRVKKSVEDSTGIPVNDVKVYIENISSGTKPRVE